MKKVPSKAPFPKHHHRSQEYIFNLEIQNTISLHAVGWGYQLRSYKIILVIENLKYGGSPLPKLQLQKNIICFFLFSTIMPAVTILTVSPDFVHRYLCLTCEVAGGLLDVVCWYFRYHGTLSWEGPRISTSTWNPFYLLLCCTESSDVNNSGWNVGSQKGMFK